MPAPTYTIAVCNYNMEHTIGRAVESMLSLVDDRFEVLVVDDASTDDSVNVIRRLQAEYDQLRLLELPPDSSRLLGETRNVSVREARGEYVLLQLDADDCYCRGIEDFTTIFHQLEAQLDFNFYLKGNNINMARRNFLLEIGPYRNLGVGGEDLDFWRRLFARDAIVWLEHGEVSREIGEGTSLVDRARRSFGVKVAEFRTGVSFWSYLRHGWSHSPTRLLWYLTICPPAYLTSLTRKRYRLPPTFRTKGELIDRMDQARRTITEIEEHYGVTIDRTALSDEGAEVFDLPPNRACGSPRVEPSGAISS